MEMKEEETDTCDEDFIPPDEGNIAIAIAQIKFNIVFAVWKSETLTKDICIII